MNDLDRLHSAVREASDGIRRIVRDGSIAVVMVDPVAGYQELAKLMWGWDGKSTVWRLSRAKTRQIADFFAGAGFLRSFTGWLAEPKPGRVILFVDGQIQAMQGDPSTGGSDTIDMMPDEWHPPGSGN